MRLNKQDGGRRQSILVTNNEVSADEQIALRKNKLRPGDPEWEALGICEYITKPRLEAAVTGKTPEGEPIKGDYKFADEFPFADGFEENVEFFNMTYEAPLAVAHNKAFARIAPLLWIRAGSEGRRIDAIPKKGFDVADTYAILFDIDNGEGFVAALGDSNGLRIAYIVSDDERAFQSICSELPEGIEAVRLYSSYLTNFEINAGAE
jgi:adenine-specific DNA-methyltransferase